MIVNWHVAAKIVHDVEPICLVMDVVASKTHGKTL